MKVYSKFEEKMLWIAAFEPGRDGELRWSDVLYCFIQGFVHWFVSADRLFERGLDLEELTLRLTGNTNKAWKEAEPYYEAAKIKGHAKAWYRFAERWSKDGRTEFGYASYIEGAAKRGYKPAIKDFFTYYDEFQAETITKDAWKRKRRQERIYYQCCKTLADENDPGAMWKLGTCYIEGTGVKCDIPRGLAIRDSAIQKWNPDAKNRWSLEQSQKIYREIALEGKTTGVKLLLGALKQMFSPRIVNVFRPYPFDEDESEK